MAAANPRPKSPESCLRLLFVIDGRYPATGGAEMQARLLAREFVAAGHSVRILAPRLDRRQLAREEVDGIEVRRLGYPRVKGLGALWLNVRVAAWLYAHRTHFDAIHVHMMHNLAAAIGWLKPWLRVPVVVKVSGAAEFDGGLLDPGLRNKIKHRLLNAGARRLDAFQCISHHTLSMLREAGYPPERLHRIPNAVDCGRFVNDRSEFREPPKVVFAGRHVAVKGLDVLLRAWSLLPRRGDARLVLAGDGPEHAALRELAVRLGVSDSVDFPGMLADVAPLLREAVIYVQASRQEGLPNAVLEAMAAQLPVVATRISGHEDVIEHEHSGLLVDAEDVAALGAAIQKLLDEPDLRARLGRQARLSVEQGFAPDRVLALLLGVYQGRRS